MKRRRSKARKEPVAATEEVEEDKVMEEVPETTEAEIEPASPPDESESGGDEAAGNDDDNEEVDFAKITGIGADDSDDDPEPQMVSIANLPPQTIVMVKNDAAAMDKKLAEIALFDTAGVEVVGRTLLPFKESLSSSLSNGALLDPALAVDDLKREKYFAELATESVHAGLDRLRQLKVKFRRPGDYFAQMIKSDDQMTRIKTSLLSQRDNIKGVQKKRADRENKRNESAVQKLAAQERNKKAKDDIAELTKLRKQRVRNRGKQQDEYDHMEDSDDEFPIDLLNIEQLDADNKFASMADIQSGKKKAWTGPMRKGSVVKGVQNNKKGGSAGINKKKPKGSKKRLGKNRRKANANRG